MRKKRLGLSDGRCIMPLLRYADQVEIAIRRKLDDFCYKPEVIGLGKNEFRALDILHRLRGLDDPLSIYKGVPVVRLKDNDGIKIYGSKSVNGEEILVKKV